MISSLLLIQKPTYTYYSVTHENPVILSGGWDKTQKAMSEAFGEEWESEFTRVTGEDAPGRHYYRNIYEEEEQKVL